MRPSIYEGVEKLAKDRGISIANMFDAIVSRELGREGIVVPDYTPPALPGKAKRIRKKSTKKVVTASEPVRVSPQVARALSEFNRERGYVPAPASDPPRPQVAAIGPVQSQHLEF
jgi:hypothetical protein